MLKPANTEIIEEPVFISVKRISETITGILCHAVQCTVEELPGTKKGFEKGLQNNL